MIKSTLTSTLKLRYNNGSCGKMGMPIGDDYLITINFDDDQVIFRICVEKTI